MTRLSFRAWRIGEHEVYTPEAVDRLVGQHFMVTEGPELAVEEKPLKPDPDNMIRYQVTEKIQFAQALAARIEDGWVVIEADLDMVPSRLRWLGSLADMQNLYTLPPEPPSVRWTVTPRPADWSAVAGVAVGPARLERTIDRGLAGAAAERWWFDRMADSKQEWLVGPEFRWVGPESEDPTRQ